MTGPLDRFSAFVDAVRGRLELGRVAYGDRSFERSPAELLAELEQEALDLAGRGFVLWTRVRALRERCDVASAPAPAGESQ